jgi:hypothetical protein
VADTLVFYNNSHIRYGELVCHFIDWNFHKKDAFWLQRVQLCNEPTTATAVKDKDIFTFEILGKQRPMIFQVFNNSELIDQFEVLKLIKQRLISREDGTSDVLTLRRIKLAQTNYKPTANILFAASLQRAGFAHK